MRYDASDARDPTLSGGFLEFGRHQVSWENTRAMNGAVHFGHACSGRRQVGFRGFLGAYGVLLRLSPLGMVLRFSGSAAGLEMVLHLWPHLTIQCMVLFCRDYVYGNAANNFVNND